jgi:O-antigen/teichoic acid export membrane protein
MSVDRRLAKNTLWNLLGLGTPLLAAILAIPFLLDELGTERFGVLALAWMVVGYFSLFDLGMGRAATQALAKARSSGESEQLNPIFWTTFTMMLGFGVAGGITVIASAEWLTSRVLNIPAGLLREAHATFLLLGLSIPFVVTSTGARGALEAYHRFGLVNAVRIPLGIFNYLGPLLVLPFSNSLIPVVGVLILSRVASWFIYLYLAVTRLEGIHSQIDFDRTKIKPLMAFGGWITVTNLVAPVMIYMDRFFIAAQISVGAVTHYAVPHDMVSKLSVIPTALVSVLFPKFTGMLATGSDEVSGVYWRAAVYLSLILTPVIAFLFVFTPEILQLWVGAEFRDSSATVMRILLLGMAMNGYARLAQTLIQSDGRADITAKLHLLEVLPYLMALLVAVKYWGIVGVACVWVARVMVDLALLHRVLVVRRTVATMVVMRLLILVLILTTAIAASGLLVDTRTKLAVYFPMLLVFVMFVWRTLFSNEDRYAVKSLFDEFLRSLKGAVR